jgi:hypothetical protein
MGTWDTRYPIAVDLSDGACAVALQMASRSGGPHVHAMLAREGRDAGGMSDEDRLGFLRSVLASPAFRGRSVALLPPLDLVRTYPLRVTPGKDESLEAAIVREAASALHVPVEEADSGRTAGCDATG